MSRLKIIIPVLIIGLGALAYLYGGHQETTVATSKTVVSSGNIVDQSWDADFRGDESDDVLIESSDDMISADDIILTEEEIERLEDIYDDVLERWDRGVEQIIVVDFGLGADTYLKYQSMREEYEEAKLAAYEQYHERMMQTHGPSYTYNASETVEAFNNPVFDEYREKLRALIGDEAYKGYLEFKDQFNEDLREKAQSRLGLFLMDF